MIEATRHHQLVRPCYPAAEAGRLVGLTPRPVRRWLKGDQRTFPDALRGQFPVARGRGSRSTCASFLDLVDLLYIKRFLDHGVSLQMAREALDEAPGNWGDALRQLTSGGQWTNAPAIREITPAD